MPKRKGNLMSSIYYPFNIEEADDKARKNKGFQKTLAEHDKHREKDNYMLSLKLYKGEYKTSKYEIFKIYEPKEREIYKLPYYPDRITHHAIMNILEPIWRKKLIKQTYSSIKGRGIHKCAKDVKRALKEHPKETTYCLKLDIRKFYPSIDHEILKKILNRWTKDAEFAALNEEIIESAPGVPIGNYLSLYYANLYLTPFDHQMKSLCKFYFRYADDIVILSNSKEFLHDVLEKIKVMVAELKLTLKPNYQIFPVDKRGIDFVGYVFFHTHILLRKSIKLNMMKLVYSYHNKKISKEEFMRRFGSYKGWLKFCNSKNLCQKIEKLTGLPCSNWNGRERTLYQLRGKIGRLISSEEHNRYTLVNHITEGMPYFTKIRNEVSIKKFKKKYGKNTKKWG